MGTDSQRVNWCGKARIHTNGSPTRIGAMTCVVMTERQQVGDFVGQVSVIWTRERAFGLPSDIDGEALHQGD